MKKIIQKIKNWYKNLPLKSSKPFQLDKQIVKSTGENLIISVSVFAVGILGLVIDGTFGWMAIITGVSLLVKDIARVFIKFIKDYSNLK